MTDRTRSRVSEFTFGSSLMTRETVERETPACLAISMMVRRLDIVAKPKTVNGIGQSAVYLNLKQPECLYEEAEGDKLVSKMALALFYGSAPIISRVQTFVKLIFYLEC